MTEFGQGLALDLTNTLARDTKLASDLLERAGVTVLKAEAQLDDLTLTIGKSVEDLIKLLVEHGVTRGLGGSDGLGVLDEVAKLGVLLLADGRLQGN